MASTYITFSLDLDGEPATVRHPTHQGSVYFDATAPQLRAFAHEILSAIDRAETDDARRRADAAEVVQS